MMYCWATQMMTYIMKDEEKIKSNLTLYPSSNTLEFCNMQSAPDIRVMLVEIQNT